MSSLYTKNLLICLCIPTVLIFLAACSSAYPPSTMAPIPLNATGTPAPTFTLPMGRTSTPSLSPSPTAALTLTVTSVPTYVVLRGVVNQEHVNCYYGPSKTYLFKYGLLKGNRLDIIGYMADTGYIKVQAIGGDNPCWMNLEFMDVQGDINTVTPVDPLSIKLPWSPYYPALSFAKAEREGDEVIISWTALQLRPGDDSEQEPYLLETWVCHDGKLIFTPVGAYVNKVNVIDETGCAEPSFGRVYGVEKHGYTKYLMFLWPKAGG